MDSRKTWYIELIHTVCCKEHDPLAIFHHAEEYWDDTIAGQVLYRLLHPPVGSASQPSLSSIFQLNLSKDYINMTIQTLRASTNGSFVVSYDDTQAVAQGMAQTILDTCEADFSSLSGWFRVTGFGPNDHINTAKSYANTCCERNIFPQEYQILPLIKLPRH